MVLPSIFMESKLAFSPAGKEREGYRGLAHIKTTTHTEFKHLIQQSHQGESKEIRGTAETEKTRSFIETQSAVLSGCTTVLTVRLNF